VDLQKILLLESIKTIRSNGLSSSRYTIPYPERRGIVPPEDHLVLPSAVLTDGAVLAGLALMGCVYYTHSEVV